MKMRIVIMLSVVSLIATLTYSFAQETKNDNVLRFGLMAQDISTVYPWDVLDSVTGSTLNNVYEGLTQFSENSTSIESALAERWDYSNDFKTWTFYLRRNVKFHNGELFNADAVVETFKFVKNFEGKVVKENDYAIKMIMDQPNAALPITLATDYYAVVSKATVESYKKKFNPPAVYGTGPFKFISWQKGKSIVLEKYDGYWGNKAKLDKVIFIPFRTNDMLIAALMDNKIDLTDGVLPANIPSLRNNPKLYFKAETGLNFGYLAINMQRKPFSDKRVRQAIAYALNKKLLISKYFITGQAGIAAKSCLPPSMFGYYKDLPELEYNPAKAKDLLKQAGYPDGFETSLIPTGAVRPYMPDPMGIATEIANQLSQIGIRAKITPAQSFSKFLEITSTQRDYDLALMGWLADTGDPNDFLTPILSAQSIGVQNASGWSNKEFDNLLVQARAQAADKRLELYKKAQILVYDEVPLIPLFNAFQLAAWSERVQGFKLHPASGRLFLKNVELK